MSTPQSGQGPGEAAGARRIYIFDTTLRDGEQSPGISLNTREKLEIAEQLVRLGVDVIEAGFPISSPGDFESVREIGKLVGDAVVVCGLSRAIPKDIETAAEALTSAKRPRIHTGIGVSESHLRDKLNITGDEAVERAVAAVKLAGSFVGDVEFYAEDAGRAEPVFLHRMIQEVVSAGATVVNIPDTTGYAYPEDFGELIRGLMDNVDGINDVIVSVHCHNDLGMATANALAGVKAGARQVECTVNGIGERAGNTAMEEVVMALKQRRDYFGAETGINTREFVRTSRMVSTITGMVVQPNKAIVGANAFAHSSGIHQDGVLKERTTYEIIDPADVGVGGSAIVLTARSGRHALKHRLGELGIVQADEEFEKTYEAFLDLADRKKEIYDEDLQALVADQARASTEIYKLDYIDVCSGTDKTPTATIRLRRNGDVIEKTATGDGQVDASCRALEQATGVEAKLMSYQVSAITGSLDAQGDVNVQLEIGGRTFLGRGVDTDIVAASARAYLNAINKYVSWASAGEAEKSSGM